MACFVSARESGSVLDRVEGMRSVLTSQSHLEVDGKNKRITHNNTTNMFTGDSNNLFNWKPYCRGRECVQIGDVDFRRVLYVESLRGYPCWRV